MDLAAKHWAIYAERGAVSHWPEARLRRARVTPQPAAGLLPAYALQCGTVSAPAQVASGQTFAVSVTMKNTGWQQWDSAAVPPMFASYHWKDARGGAVVYDGVRTALPKAVEPGESVTVEVQVHAPAQPGQYRLSLDLVHESVTWLSDQGCVFPEQLIHVVSPVSARSR